MGAGKWRCKSNLKNVQYLILSNALVASRNVQKQGSDVEHNNWLPLLTP